MNVQDLIDELSKMPPHLPVRVFIPTVYGGNDGDGNFDPDLEVHLSKDCDSWDADKVRYEGGHILIEAE